MHDEDAWITYPHHRKWFNKLYVSETFGYNCGPCGVAPSKSGHYIVRPIYNLSGMGVGAKRKEIEAGDITSVPPGYFWCEWFNGDQLSVTYRYKNDQWVAQSAYKGIISGSEIYRFFKWIRVDDLESVPECPFELDELSDVNVINVEFIGGKVIEVHLRPSPDPVEAEIVPVWEDNSQETIDIYGNLGYTYIHAYDDADGFLDNPRIGFMVKGD